MGKDSCAGNKKYNAPWTARRCGLLGHDWSIEDQRSVQVARVVTSFSLKTGHEISPADAQRNAELIAVAPEMLRCLVNIFESGHRLRLEDFDEVSRLLGKLKAVYSFEQL